MPQHLIFLVRTIFFGILVFSGDLFAAERLRIMAANTSSGNFQAYESPGIRIFQGLDPDIILIQEFNYRDGSLRSLVDTAFGEEFEFFVEPGSEQIPNGIISRYPIIESGEWIDTEVSDRDFAWARINIPGDKNLWAVSVHFLTSGSGVRNSEAQALVSFIQANVPSGDYLVVGGDFNTDSFNESALNTLSAVVETDGRPDDQNGSTGTNASRAKPYDQVLPDAALEGLETPVVISGHSFSYAEGLVFDSRVFTPLSAVSPVQFGDSGVSMMQHMAVIRDFLIPDGQSAVEPSSYPTNFSASVTNSTLLLTWTDVVSQPEPFGYVVIGSVSDSIAAPLDGLLPEEDSDLSDGSAVRLIAYGEEMVSFNGLESETEYFFEIYPYTSETSPNYKTDGTVPVASATTGVIVDNTPSAPVLGETYFPYASGFTLTWEAVEGATGYRLDVSESANFTTGIPSFFFEDFDDSTESPAGWENSGTSTSNLATHYSTAPYARALGSGDTLATPPIDFPTELEFFVEASGNGDGNTATISYAVDGGSDWQPLGSFVVSNEGGAEFFDLTGTPDLSEATQVRFRFESSFNTWYLDDVGVASAAEPGFVDGYDDLVLGASAFHSVMGLEPDTNYYFRLRAENASGVSTNSLTGSAQTTASGTALSVWAQTQGIGAVSEFSDFDQDSLSDQAEYVFATEASKMTSPADVYQVDSYAEGIRVTHRRSVAPNLIFEYYGSSELSSFGAPLAEGDSVGEYTITQRENFGFYEVVTVEIPTGGADQYFLKIEVDSSDF